MAKIVGAFNGHWDGVFLGEVADGFTIEHFYNGQLITGDNEGLTPQDIVFQGYEVFLECTLMEYDNAAVQAAFWPWSTTLGQQGAVGRTAMTTGSELAKAILLDHDPENSESAGVGTPAATEPTTFTASRAILAPGFPVRMLYSPVTYRSITLRFMILPTRSGGNTTFYTLA